MNRAALLARLAKQYRGAQLPSMAEQAGESSAQLLGTERLVLEERQLPAVERLGESGIGIGERQTRKQVA